MPLSRRLVYNADFMVVMFFALLCIILLLMPTGFENRRPLTSHYERARVLTVDNSDVQQTGIIRVGTQRMTVEILGGSFKGQKTICDNHLKGKMELDEIYAPGHTILLEFAVRDGKIGPAFSRGHYRIHIEFILLGLFALVLAAVGGWTGFKALLSFLFSALMLWKVMVPVFLKGYDPIWVSLAVVAGLTAAIAFLVGGLTRKGLVTFLGAFLGLCLTCALALLFSRGFKIHGAVRPFAETLLYSGYYHLNLTRIFLAGIFIAASGAVMDLSMDIAASLHEISQKKPDATRRELIASGMAVGRSVIGTMTTTLLLAYSGGYITMMMLFMAQGVPLVNIFNLHYVAAEVMNTIVGSFGLVTVAPFTALVGGLVYGRPLNKEKAAERVTPQPGSSSPVIAGK
ncbi:YibE/F family protein [uncultured Desulfosarcina sp.]|uniref:YibE/F family protein n=1 Tax=uncultured Desulfosarcina sp. TaxID=218289 RepID=UPI0029C87B88|nr:YibE/F family protein [uncultured Desulfosarcina sp.]